MNECSACLMNSGVDPKIVFDSKGICSYCHSYYQSRRIVEKRIKSNHFENEIKKIKKTKTKQYDCVLGISAGTDSSYVAYLLKKAGLNVLLVHCNNGWNTELADSNLNKIKEYTGFDLEIRHIDATEFYKVQKSFIKSRVIDIELLSDHVNIASIYEAAYRHKIPWLITGENINTELLMPKCWVHNKNDWRQIKDINNKHEQADLSSFPRLGPYKKFFIDKKLRIKYFKPLNSLNYRNVEASKILKEEFDWNPYGGKHFESIFTVFFQCYILPEYYNADKRIPHFSNLICSGILTKEEAKEKIKLPLIEKEKLEYIKEQVFSKLKIDESEFRQIMQKPEVPHSAFKSCLTYNKRVQPLIKAFKSL